MTRATLILKLEYAELGSEFGSFGNFLLDVLPFYLDYKLLFGALSNLGLMCYLLNGLYNLHPPV